MNYFFCYDITNTHKRNQISMALEQFGLRVQKSVFQCDVPAEKAEEIKTTLLALIDKKQDSLFFCPICDACLEKVRIIGNKTMLQTVGFEIL
jgi:CRISPR-associated protein Cas2